MSIPLDKLIDKDMNVYELTCVAIKEAELLSAQGIEDSEDGENKIVSLVLEKVLNDEVEYSVGEE
ncbi:MAG: hypothetical protein WC162_02340 [Sphaerochaetaceae bacterium]|nr:hypothetical protein [Sphaerochaetaceae bacterium]